MKFLIRMLCSFVLLLPLFQKSSAGEGEFYPGYQKKLYMSLDEVRDMISNEKSNEKLLKTILSIFEMRVTQNGRNFITRLEMLDESSSEPFFIEGKYSKKKSQAEIKVRVKKSAIENPVVITEVLAELKNLFPFDQPMGYFEKVDPNAEFNSDLIGSMMEFLGLLDVDSELHRLSDEEKKWIVDKYDFKLTRMKLNSLEFPEIFWNSQRGWIDAIAEINLWKYKSLYESSLSLKKFKLYRELPNNLKRTHLQSAFDLFRLSLPKNMDFVTSDIDQIESNFYFQRKSMYVNDIKNNPGRLDEALLKLKKKNKQDQLIIADHFKEVINPIIEKFKNLNVKFTDLFNNSDYKEIARLIGEIYLGEGHDGSKIQFTLAPSEVAFFQDLKSDFLRRASLEESGVFTHPLPHQGRFEVLLRGLDDSDSSHEQKGLNGKPTTWSFYPSLGTHGLLDFVTRLGKGYWNRSRLNIHNLGRYEIERNGFKGAPLFRLLSSHSENPMASMFLSFTKSIEVAYQFANNGFLVILNDKGSSIANAPTSFNDEIEILEPLGIASSQIIYYKKFELIQKEKEPGFVSDLSKSGKKEMEWVPQKPPFSQIKADVIQAIKNLGLNVPQSITEAKYLETEGEWDDLPKNKLNSRRELSYGLSYFADIFKNYENSKSIKIVTTCSGLFMK